MEHSGRRKFIGNSVLALGSIGLISAPAGCKPVSVTLENMFVHHVFFWLKEPGTKDVTDLFEKELHQLATIETIRYRHIGRPADTNRGVIDSSYTFSLLLLFDDKAGQDIYQEHPVHLEFIKRCSQLWEKVVVYDIG